MMVEILDPTHEEMIIDPACGSGGFVIEALRYIWGKLDKEAEKYIRDFRSWTTATGRYLCIEIAAVNGRFTLDFLQPFSSPIYVNAFLKELDDNGITYDLQDVMKLELPNIRLPWSV